MKRRSQLSDEAADFVRELIMSGRLRPGDIVRQDEVASELDMSATPVREGLLVLRGEGLVILKPRIGWFVAPLTGADIRDLFRAQALVAGELAARAVQKCDGSLLGEIVELQLQLVAAAERNDIEGLERLNHAFHRAINRAAASPKLAWVLLNTARCAPQRFFSTIRGWPEASVNDHEEIIRAIRAGDEDAVRNAMATHVEHAGRLLAANFDELISRNAQRAPIEV